MDQIQRDKIAAKLKKIKALAERGVGGEKETAMRMYEDLKARYELEDEEIMLDAVTLHWFGYADELEERVLRWIFYKVTGDASYHIYTGKYSRRKKRGCDCTEIEAAEITLLYNFYKEELKRELEAFLVAFRWGNDLFPDETTKTLAGLSFQFLFVEIVKQCYFCCFNLRAITTTLLPAAVFPSVYVVTCVTRHLVENPAQHPFFQFVCISEPVKRHCVQHYFFVFQFVSGF